MEVVHRTSVQEFLKRMEGKPTQAVCGDAQKLLAQICSL
jgi:hypothetical protein